MQTYRIIVGLDWADQEHTVCVLDQQEQTKQIETVADIYAFLFQTLGVTPQLATK